MGRIQKSIDEIKEYNNNPNYCLNCGKPILWIEGGPVLSSVKEKKFCNRSCAAIYNNTHREKKKYYCEKCGTLIAEGFNNYTGRRLCDDCNPNKMDWSKITYGEAKTKRTYQVNSRIRELARTAYEKSDKPKKCVHCGYDKYYEIHHIKNISSFDDSTPVSEINNLDNLIALCPNCHWEIEHGIFSLS